ncbi:uncharacterized protein SOCG_01271 [Schizosaccharomyces octosporus yFS286]|uniref:C3H1-type domain-containing protein n=1 Tax=Schizosaccharomyces octosporus (strain yFS286) TaxID=483514 RepID=S9PU97_SCHOY|nr:uncharacterized protein SOCG_01271 [Schizosaccharomyces octosporus yFS286]EPX71053.1 hypothetical protein SOCG_01271 [Schizosaccharomyces octosporus yFS286]
MVYSPMSRPQVPLTFRQWPPYDYKTDPLTIPRFPNSTPLQNTSSLPTSSSLLDTYGSSLLSKSANTLGNLKPANNTVLSPDETFPSTVMPQYRSMDVGTPKSPDADGWPWHLTSNNTQGYAWSQSFNPNASANYLHSSSRNLNDYPSPISSLDSLPSKSSVGSSGLDFHPIPSSLNDDAKPTPYPMNMAGVSMGEASSHPSFTFAQNSVDRVFNPKPKLYYPSKSSTNVRTTKPVLSRQSYSSGSIPSIPLKSSINTTVGAQPSALSNQISPVVGTPVLNSSKFSAGALPEQASPEQLKQTNINNAANQRPRAATPGSNNGSTTSTGKRALYKTEPCKNWQTTGNCRYGNKCQFAHGDDELKEPPRHPKYKSEPCRSFMLYGYCPYGLRCCFLHDEQRFLNSQQNIQEVINTDIK